jgi:hypothetical protein
VYRLQVGCWWQGCDGADLRSALHVFEPCMLASILHLPEKGSSEVWPAVLACLSAPDAGAGVPGAVVWAGAVEVTTTT